MATKEPAFDPAATIVQLLNKEPDSVAKVLTLFIMALRSEGVPQEIIKHAMTTAFMTFIADGLATGTPEEQQRALSILRQAETLADRINVEDFVHH